MRGSARLDLGGLVSLACLVVPLVVAAGSARAEPAPPPAPIPAAGPVPPAPGTGPAAPARHPPMWPYEVPVNESATPRGHRDPAMMVAGIVVTALGIATLPISIGLMVPRARGMTSTCTACTDAWTVLLPAGAIIPPAIGIPLWVNGAKSPGAWTVSALPTVTPGAGSVTLRWSF